MRIGDIAPHVAHDLVEALKRRASNFKDFPFHIHYRCHESSAAMEYHRDKFSLYWTTKAEHFGTPNMSDVVCELHCQVVGLHNQQVLLAVIALQRKHRYPGQEVPEHYVEHNYYKQEWRGDEFIIGAQASAIWTIMEAHADFDRAVTEVMSA